MLTFPTQSPDDRRQVGFDFSAKLPDGDWIIAASINLFAVPSDLVIETPAAAGAVVTAWIRGGSAGIALFKW